MWFSLLWTFGLLEAARMPFNPNIRKLYEPVEHSKLPCEIYWVPDQESPMKPKTEEDMKNILRLLDKYDDETGGARGGYIILNYSLLGTRFGVDGYGSILDSGDCMKEPNYTIWMIYKTIIAQDADIVTFQNIDVSVAKFINRGLNKYKKYSYVHSRDLVEDKGYVQLCTFYKSSRMKAFRSFVTVAKNSRYYASLKAKEADLMKKDLIKTPIRDELVMHTVFFDEASKRYHHAINVCLQALDRTEQSLYEWDGFLNREKAQNIYVYLTLKQALLEAKIIENNFSGSNQISTTVSGDFGMKPKDMERSIAQYLLVSANVTARDHNKPEPGCLDAYYKESKTFQGISFRNPFNRNNSTDTLISMNPSKLIERTSTHYIFYSSGLIPLFNSMFFTERVPTEEFSVLGCVGIHAVFSGLDNDTKFNKRRALSN